MNEAHPTTRDYRVQDRHARQYLRRSDGVKLKSSTAGTYDGHLRQYEIFLQDRDKSILDAEFDDLLDFIAHCVRIGNRQGTIGGKVSTIGGLYRHIRLYTEDRDMLNFDPLRIRTIDLSEYNTPEPIEREALSRAEIRQLFDAFDSYRNRLMAVVGVETGLRNSDIRGIRLEDLSLDAGEIHVHNPKNSKSYDVPITDNLAFEIDYWIRHHRAGFVANTTCEYLFPSQNGTKIEANSSLNRVVKAAAERAGIQDTLGTSRVVSLCEDATDSRDRQREWYRVTVHTLRHSCLTLMKNDGVDLTYRQMVANHSSPRTTQGYTHSSNEVFERVRDRFNPPR